MRAVTFKNFLVVLATYCAIAAALRLLHSVVLSAFLPEGDVQLSPIEVFLLSELDFFEALAGSVFVGWFSARYGSSAPLIALIATAAVVLVARFTGIAQFGFPYPAPAYFLNFTYSLVAALVAFAVYSRKAKVN